MQTPPRPPYASFIPRRLEPRVQRIGRRRFITRNFTRASQITIFPRFSIQLQYDTPRPVVAPLTLMKNGTHRRPPLQRSVESAVKSPRMGDLILEGQYSYIFALRPPFHRKHRSCCRWFWLDMSHAVVGAAQRLHHVL